MENKYVCYLENSSGSVDHQAISAEMSSENFMPVSDRDNEQDTYYIYQGDMDKVALEKRVKEILDKAGVEADIRIENP